MQVLTTVKLFIAIENYRSTFLGPETSQRMKIYTLIIIVALTALAIYKNVRPYSKFEIWALHKVYSFGSGWDDAAFSIVSNHPTRYSPQIERMLRNARAGSNDEEISLSFVEFVIEEPGIREALKSRGDTHTDPASADLIASILEGPPETVTVIEDDGGVTVKSVLPKE